LFVKKVFSHQARFDILLGYFNYGDKIMKKKFLTIVVTATICLFGVVALASPITLINDVFVSVKKTLLQTETQTQSPSSEIEIKPTPTEAIQTTPSPSSERRKTIIQKSQKSVSNGVAIETPEYVLWTQLFARPAMFEKVAEASRQKGNSNASWIHSFVRNTKLSLENAEIFKEKATEYFNELEPVTARRKEIALQYKIARENRTKVPDDLALRKEQSQLQEKRKELALKYRDEFRKAIDEESFKAFEEWIKTEFVKHFRSVRYTGKDIYKAKVENGEINPNEKNIPEDHHK
jgi:hypothetical protein